MFLFIRLCYSYRNLFGDKSCCCCTVSRAFIFGMVSGALGSGLILALSLSFLLTKPSARTTTITTTSMSTTTVTITCASGYSLTPTGLCVNTLIDFLNCGSFGYECSSNYTSCSAGICSTAPAVHLKGGVSVFNVTSNIDDRMFSVNLPLNITMYNYSSSNVTFTTNGVSCQMRF